MFKLFRKKKPEEISIDHRKKVISTKYSYEWKSEIPEKERDATDYPSRPFCKKMMELNRLYSRFDIELISEKLGYSVFDRCGGDGCRHMWKSNIVVSHQ